MSVATVEAEAKSFLKKAEADVLIVVKDATKVLPILDAAAKIGADATGNAELDPVIDAFVNKMTTLCAGAGAMVTAAQGSAASGAAKAAAVASVLTTTLQQTQLVSTAGIADMTKYQTAVLGIASQFGALFDSLKPTATPVPAAPAEPATPPVTLASSQA
jgi:hypothetical protein